MENYMYVEVANMDSEEFGAKMNELDECVREGQISEPEYERDGKGNLRFLKFKRLDKAV